MKIYNTLTKQKEEFVPIEEGKVRMYVCGPTVYNFIHIGNARPIVFFDTVRRYFEYKGYEVNFVSNFTDVDDKIIQKSIEENVPTSQITDRYIAAYEEDTRGLNVLPPTTRAKATEEIPDMIDMISELIQKGHAYEKNGSVYYRTRSFDGYGKLSKKNIDDLESGARIAVNDEKDDPLDFVLWKPKKPGEIAWQSPWSEGRPGWHIECSAMSRKYLGEQIDIHGGGEDLVFPHHENEIAQTEGCTGKTFANYWMHNAFLNVDNKKMSKSDGSFFTVRDILKEYEPAVLRFFQLNVHYRMPINFSHEIIESAKNSLERIRNAVDRLKNIIDSKQSDEDKRLDEIEILEKFAEHHTKFDEVMDDDFNTADAITAVFEMVKLANTSIDNTNSKAAVKQVLAEIELLCDVLGIDTKRQEAVLDDEVEKLIEERQAARKNKDFARADEIRNKLSEMGIILEDTREGVKWKRA